MTQPWSEQEARARLEKADQNHQGFLGQEAQAERDLHGWEFTHAREDLRQAFRMISEFREALNATASERGWQQYLDMVVAKYDHRIRVYESSLAFEGAHVWLTIAGPTTNNLNTGMPREEIPMQLSVPEAARLASALMAFVTHAEQGWLTEPAHRLLETQKDE